MFESLAPAMKAALPIRLNDLPKTLLSATKTRLESNWDLISAYFSGLHLRTWQPLNGLSPFFADESIMPDPRSQIMFACCRFPSRSVGLWALWDVVGFPRFVDSLFCGQGQH